MERIVVAFIKNDEGKLLLLKRASHKRKGDMWNVLSGRIETGEEPDDCLWRELKEELGDQFQATLLRQSQYIDKQEDGTWETHLYVLQYTDGEVVLNDEHSEYQWVAVDELDRWDIIPSYKEDLKHITL